MVSRRCNLRSGGGGLLFSKGLFVWAALLAAPSVCDADKAAYSLDLVGIKSGTAYTVSANVGAGGPAFRLIADTGSSNDAVLGANCCGKDAAVTYSCAASSTCVASSTEVFLAFAGASIAGHFVSDTWSSSQFGSLTKEFLVIEQQDTFYRSEYDGITGLAYKALAKPTGSPKLSFYENLVASKSGTDDAFGMLLCGIMQPRLVQENYTMHAGQLLIGGTDGLKGEAYYKGPMLYTPIAQEAWYVVIVSDIGFNGQSLGLPCSSYNEPQAIIDSGTSNIAFPSDVYNALMAQIKTATKKAVPTFADTFFDYRKSCCGKDYCDPADAQLALLSLPSIYITLALQDDEKDTGTTSHYTVEIPPEYYFRPEMNGPDSNVPCRAIGIAEGSSIVLGDVFMDGLFAYHDRTKSKLGLAVADNCPNKVTSTKIITKMTSKTDDWCDCFSSTLKSKSSLSRYVPWGSGCFFMPWWLYVVVASGLVVAACIGVLAYWYWTGKRDKRQPSRGSVGASTSAAATVPMVVAGGSEATRTTRSNTNGSTAYAEVTDKYPVPAQPVTGHQHQHQHQLQQQQHNMQMNAGQNYARMSSPRERMDSETSSIALLMSSEDAASGSSSHVQRRPPPLSTPVSSVSVSSSSSSPPPQQQRRTPSRKNSDRSTNGSTGFLL